MRIIVSVVLFAFLAGCAGPKGPGPDFIDPLNQHTRASPTPDQAVVIVGYRVIDSHEPTFGSPVPNTQGSWVRIDPKTRARSGQKMPYFLLFGGSNPDRFTVYKTYAITPGFYALGWVEYGTTNFQPTQFAEISRTGQSYGYNYIINYYFSPRAVARPIAPVFEANAGDVIYIGDIVLDFHTKDHIGWTLERSDDQARLALAKIGLAERMSYRQPKRADGTPVQSGDSVDYKWDE